jgi:hypothetical protein
VVGAGALVAVEVVARGGEKEGGPLACGDCAVVESGMGLDVGRAGTYGVDVLENRGDEPAVLDRISFEGRSRGLEILAPLAMRVGDYRGVGLAAGLIRGFPPARVRGAAKPVAGFVVDPYRGRDDAVELLIGVRPRRAGTLSYRAIRLHYHVGHTRYAARFTTALKICAPEARYLRLRSCRGSSG